MARKTLSNLTTRSLSAALVVCTGACDGTDEAPPAPPLISCPTQDQAPLFLTNNRPTCTRVGANLGVASGAWPDTSGAPTPIVYVSPGTGAGAGTRESPDHDLATALERAPAPGTIVLARGTYDLTASIAVHATVTLRGAGGGDGGTTITMPPGTAAFDVNPSGNSNALAFSLTGLRLRGREGSAPTGGSSAALQVQGANTRLNLRDIVIERVTEALHANDLATVCARGLSVLRAQRAGLVAQRGAAMLVRDFVIRDGENLGVLADESLVSLHTGLIANNARDGVALRGARRNPPPAACEGVGFECPSMTLCEDLVVPRRCLSGREVDGGVQQNPRERSCRDVSSFEEVAVIGNGVTGLRAELAPPQPDAGEVTPYLGAVFRGRRMVIGNTRVPLPGTIIGGDGLYAGPGARGELDPNVTRDDPEILGSLVVNNTRMGLLIDGDRTSSSSGTSTLRAWAEVSVSGAWVSDNQGPGMYVQRGARVVRLGYGRFERNVALGVGVTSGGRVDAIQCEHFLGTRPGTISLASGTSPTQGDGLSMTGFDGTLPTADGPTSATTRITQSEFRNNGRYGIALRGFPVTFVFDELANSRNVAQDNGRGVSLPGMMLTPAIRGLAAPDFNTSPPIAQGALSTPDTSP